jgi:hypothetical protein
LKNFITSSDPLGVVRKPGFENTALLIESEGDDTSAKHGMDVVSVDG